MANVARLKNDPQKLAFITQTCTIENIVLIRVAFHIFYCVMLLGLTDDELLAISAYILPTGVDPLLSFLVLFFFVFSSCLWYVGCYVCVCV